jgi:hypothetical protein
VGIRALRAAQAGISRRGRIDRNPPNSWKAGHYCFAWKAERSGTSASLPLPCEQPASSWWGGAPATGRSPPGVDGQHHGTRCLEGHHALGAQRVHLLGRGCQAADDPRTPHSPDTGGAGGRPASALLLAGLQAPRPRCQVAERKGRGRGSLARGGWRHRRLARSSALDESDPALTGTRPTHGSRGTGRRVRAPHETRWARTSSPAGRAAGRGSPGRGPRRPARAPRAQVAARRRAAA